LKNVTVLVVDDSKTVQIVIGEVLSTALGITKIHSAFNGKQALEILKTKKIDFILSDWNMPELSGEALLYEVRQSKDWSETPFVMMSANKHRDFIITAIQLGVSDYIVKPFKPEELEAVIRKAWAKSNKIAGAKSAGLPKHKFTIALGGETIPADMVSINRAVVIIRLEYSEKLRLFSEYEMNIQIRHPDFPEVEGPFIIGPFKGALRRIEAEEALRGTSKACTLSLSISSTTFKPDVERDLNRLLSWIKKQSDAYIED